MEYGINLVGTFQSEKGLGTGVRSLAASLKEASIPFSCLNYCDTLSENNDLTFTEFAENNQFLVNLVHLGADSVPSFAHYKRADFFKGRYNIGFWNWELDSFPEKWIGHVNYFHEIWVPSKHTEQSLKKKSGIPVRRIPYPISVPESLPEGINREFFNLPKDKTIFLFAFDFSSVFARKNPQAAILAFTQAFPATNDVMLLIKTVHGNKDPQGMQELVSLCSNKNNIRIFDAVLSRPEMHALTKLSDVFISLHRCEGFGLNIFEAMAMAKPVIVTGYSSNMDYTLESNSFLVNYKLVPIDKDYGPYQKGEVWAEPDIEHAAALMRLAYEKRDLAETKGKLGALHIQENLSLAKIGNLIKSSLVELMKKNQVVYNYSPSLFPDVEKPEPFWTFIKRSCKNLKF